MAQAIEQADLPTIATTELFLTELCSEELTGCFPGETLKFPHLKNELGFEVLEITAVAMPDYEDDDYDDDYENFDNKAVVKALGDCSKYDGLDESEPSTIIEAALKKWLIPESHIDSILFIGYQITDKPISNGKKEIKVEVMFDYNDVFGEDVSNILSSPFYTKFWDPIMNSVIAEGVCFSNTKVSDGLRDSLRKNLDKLATETRVDFHPNSDDVVRDLVHPSLFPYVEGVSKFKEGKSKPKGDEQGNKDKYDVERDFWGRTYENSKYQWLPTPFIISKEGKCTISEYINNLDSNNFPELYGNLEKLFELFLPYFEEVWSYSKAMQFWNDDSNDDCNFDDDFDFGTKTPVDFKGRELQVITKIVEYKLKPDQTYEGVWHVEGMSHENIVMTGIYFIDRDEDLQGGDLRFKRGIHVAERKKIFISVPQLRAVLVDNFACEGIMPLGNFPTEEGYLLVFPNCHIHKISKLVNKTASESVRRRIVVFFVVNPDKEIISTAHIARQQDGAMSWSNALSFRLEMMEERKYQKDKFNTRDIELCEH